MRPLVEVRGLAADFRAGALGRRVRVLDRIDLDVQTGETLAIVGESGSGKTTLARAMLRLIEPSAGTIRFDGVDLRQLPPKALRRKRRELQMVFQDASGSLDPRQTVGESILEPLELHRIGTDAERGERVRSLMHAVALDPALASRRPTLLSGGEQQRVVIARSLALEPRLLVADEPVSALDASVGAQILNLLAELQERLGLTLVVISHALGVVRHLATRVVVMYLGRIVEEAPVEVFFSAPKHPYSRALLGAAPLHGEPSSVTAPPTGCRFHPRCAEALPRCGTETPSPYVSGETTRVCCFLYTGEGK